MTKSRIKLTSGYQPIICSTLLRCRAVAHSNSTTRVRLPSSSLAKTKRSHLPHNHNLETPSIFKQSKRSGNMVQIHERGQIMPNQYWKLDCGTRLSVYSLQKYLSNENFATLKQSTKSRLIELYIRCQRGMLSYEGLPLRELETLRLSVECKLAPMLHVKHSKVCWKRPTMMPPSAAFLNFHPSFDKTFFYTTSRV